MPTKWRGVLSLEEVPQIFSDDRARELAVEAELPPAADLARFAVFIRHAAENYACESGNTDDNAVHHEIKAFYSAAARRRYGLAAEQRAALSPRTRDFIDKRSGRPSVPWKLPTVEALRDAATRDDACTTIVSLLRIGGRWQDGRKRPNGKRSKTFVPLLHAPELQRNLPKRVAEINFVLLLELAYLNVTGRKPPYTAHRDNLGPFARMVKECLKLAGTPTTNDGVAGLINELHRRRKHLQSRELQRFRVLLIELLLWRRLLFEQEQLRRPCQDPLNTVVRCRCNAR